MTQRTLLASLLLLCALPLHAGCTPTGCSGVPNAGAWPGWAAPGHLRYPDMVVLTDMTVLPDLTVLQDMTVPASAPTYADNVAGHNYSASGTTVSQAYTGASVGNILFFTASNSNSRALTGCTDTLGNSYSILGTTTGGGTCWSKVTTGGNGTITGTFAGAITLATWLYVRVSGSTAASPIDGYAIADATGTYGIPFNLTSSTTGMLLWMGPDNLDSILYSSGLDITAAPFTAQVANQLYWAAGQSAGVKNTALNMYNSGALQIGTYVAVK